MFLLTLKFHPKGVVCPCPGAIYMYKIMRVKSDFKDICFNSSKWLKWQEVSVDIKILSPMGLSAPYPRLYTFIKSWKDVYKIRGWRDVINLQQMTKVMRPFYWHQNLAKYLFLEKGNQWFKWQELSASIKNIFPTGCLPLPLGYIYMYELKQNII